MSHPAKTRDVKAAKSQEYVNDTSDDSGSDNEVHAKVRVTGASARAQAQNSSSGESNDEFGSERSIASSDSQRQAATKRGREALGVPEDTPVKRTKISVTQPSRLKNDKFKPPQGYDRIELSATDMVSQAGNMFSNLDGKQIWHITAPASLPITSIQSLDIPAALRGESILQHEGVGYSMFAASSKGEGLLIPHGTQSMYSKSGLEISSSFHLRELPQDDKVNHPTDSAGNASAGLENMDYQKYFAWKRGTPKAARTQPSGLLMRYQPFGHSISSSEPYILHNPDIFDEKQGGVSYANASAVAPVYDDDDDDDDGAQARISTPKKAKNHPKTKRKETPNEHIGSGRGEVETDVRYDGAAIATPRVRTKTNGTISGTEERRKEKAKRKKEIREKD